MSLKDHETQPGTSNLPIVKVEVTVRLRSGRVHKTVLETDDVMELESTVETMVSAGRHRGGYFSLSSPGIKTVLAAADIESVELKEKS